MPSPTTWTPGTLYPRPLSGLRWLSNGLAGRVAPGSLRGPQGGGGGPGKVRPLQETRGEWAGVGTGSVLSSVYLRMRARGPHDSGIQGTVGVPGQEGTSQRGGRERGTRHAWGTGGRCPVGLQQHPRVPWPFRFPACLPPYPGGPCFLPSAVRSLCR